MGVGLLFEYIPLRYPRVNLTKFLFCPQFPPKLREQSRLHIFTFGNSTYLLTYFLSKYKLSSRENMPCIFYSLLFWLRIPFLKRGRNKNILSYVKCTMDFLYLWPLLHITFTILEALVSKIVSEYLTSLNLLLKFQVPPATI